MQTLCPRHWTALSPSVISPNTLQLPSTKQQLLHNGTKTGHLERLFPGDGPTSTLSLRLPTILPTSRLQNTRRQTQTAPLLQLPNRALSAMHTALAAAPETAPTPPPKKFKVRHSQKDKAKHNHWRDDLKHYILILSASNYTLRKNKKRRGCLGVKVGSSKSRSAVTGE